MRSLAAPSVDSFPNSSLLWSSALVAEGAGKIRRIPRGTLAAERVFHLLEGLVEELVAMKAREEASLTYLLADPHVLGRTLLRNSPTVLSSRSPVTCLAVHPSGFLFAGESNSSLTVFTEEPSGRFGRGDVLQRLDSGPPKVCADGALGLIVSIEREEFGSLVRNGPGLWKFEPIGIMPTGLVMLKGLPDGSVAALGSRALRIFQNPTGPKAGRAWTFEEHAGLRDARDVHILADGWVVVAEAHSVSLFHRGWSAGSYQRCQLTSYAPRRKGAEISAIRVLGDRRIAIGRQCGFLSILEPSSESQWRELVLTPHGPPVVALQALRGGGVCVIRADGTVSAWENVIGGPLVRKGPSGSWFVAGRYLSEEQIARASWRERPVVSREDTARAVQSDTFSVNSGCVMSDGRVFLAGGISQKAGFVAVYSPLASGGVV